MFTRLQPVLGVADLAAEVAFYRALGFEVTHEEQDFVGLVHGAILFGLQTGKPAQRESLVWQIGSADVHAVHALACEQGLDVVEGPKLQEWGEWTLRLATPGGYELVVEGEAGASS